jgi:hypothetical protein
MDLKSLPMAEEIRITVAGSGRLAKEARAALEKAVTDYGCRILEDATRTEKARQLNPGPPMITDTTIALADLNAKNGLLRPVRSFKQNLVSLVELAMVFASGGFAGYIAKPFGAIGFAVCAVAGLICHNWNSSHGG